MHSQRPRDLPEFQSPPLNEVVLGIQFKTPRGYQGIRAWEVWNLFSKRFGHVQEHQPIEPRFEMFGLPQQADRLELNILKGPFHNRYWFLNESKDELIQFQKDRLLHNWRKLISGGSDYPRFESIRDRFRSEIYELENYFKTIGEEGISIEQCEISYINHIVFDKNEDIDLQKWLRGIAAPSRNMEDFSLEFREKIISDEDKPVGRLYSSMRTTISNDGARVIVLEFTARGRPNGTNVSSAIEFIEIGRSLIVHRFAEATTEHAHTRWGRKK